MLVTDFYICGFCSIKCKLAFFVRQFCVCQLNSNQYMTLSLCFKLIGKTGNGIVTE